MRISLLLGLLFGVANMGTPLAALVLPQIAGAYGVSVGDSTWTITLYVLMLAVTTAVYGRVADLVGVRIPLMVGLALLLGGGLSAALAPTFPILLMSRLLQGAGAAAVPTLGVTVLSMRYEGLTRGRALSRFAAVASALVCLGPLTGGLIEPWLGWRVVVAVPVAGCLVVPFLWRALVGEGTGARLDVLGAVLVGLAAAGLVLIAQSPSTGLAVAVIGLVLVLLAVPLATLQVRRRPHGFLPLVVIRNRTVVRCAVASSSVPCAWFGLQIAVPTTLVSQGWETWQIGVLLVPSALVALTVPRLTAPLISRWGTAAAIGAAAVVASATLGIASSGVHWKSAPILALAVVLITMAFGVGQPALSAAVAAAVAPEVRGVALGVGTLVFLTGGSIGSALIGGLGDVVGTASALAGLCILPLLGATVLAPEMLRERREGRGI